MAERITRAFDAEEFTPFDMSRLAALTPAQWETAVFVPNPSLQLLKSSYPVNPYLQAVYNEDAPAIPARRTSYVAIYRKDYKVWRHDMPPATFAILAALAAGEPFGTALGAGGEHEEDFQFWFSSWSADGLFVDVRT